MHSHDNGGKMNHALLNIILKKLVQMYPTITTIVLSVQKDQYLTILSVESNTQTAVDMFKLSYMLLPDIEEITCNINNQNIMVISARFQNTTYRLNFIETL